MSIGNTVDGGGLNAKLGDAAVSLRSAADLAREVSAYISKVGLAALQLPPFGFSAPDASAIVNDAGYLATLSGVYFGTATQGSQFNFDDALTVPRGINP